MRFLLKQTKIWGQIFILDWGSDLIIDFETGEKSKPFQQTRRLRIGETEIMEYDKDKVDELTLALLYLVMHDESEVGARAWKGFDWNTMNRLHEKGFISNPIGKAKSVAMTPEGCRKAKELFEKHFVMRNR